MATTVTIKLHVLIYFNLGSILINVFVRRIMMVQRPPEIKEYLLTRAPFAVTLRCSDMTRHQMPVSRSISVLQQPTIAMSTLFVLIFYLPDVHAHVKPDMLVTVLVPALDALTKIIV